MISWLTCDVFDGLATLEDGSIDLVVTSPPFLALRSYLPADHPDKGREIGSEATPAEFLDVMLRVVAELRRVLAPHGSIAIELGDTYAGSGGAGGDYNENGWREHQAAYQGSGRLARYSDDRGNPDGMRDPTFSGANTTTGSGQGWPLAKSKTLIPELFRIALAYGFNPLTGEPSPAGRWRVRNVVTWCRPNPPVGALGDKWRPATSDVVVACVSGRRFWDDLATRKPHQDPGRTQVVAGARVAAERFGEREVAGRVMEQNTSGAPLLDYWEIPLLDGEEAKPYGPKEPKLSQRTTNGPKAKEAAQEVQVKFDVRMESNEAGAPLLDYWEIPPTGYSGAHYAVYPPALVEPLVKAMCPQRVCRTCGEPSRRIVESERIRLHDGVVNPPRVAPTRTDGGGTTAIGMRHGMGARYETTGFTDCGHDNFRPGRVLDPFAGSGTTLAVASGHGHDAIGFDLDSRNEDLARDRVGPLLWQEA